MSNRQDFQEAFPGNENDPGPDHVTLILGMVLVLIVAVIVAVQYIPLP